jgi:CHASE2 domain
MTLTLTRGWHWLKHPLWIVMLSLPLLLIEGWTEDTAVAKDLEMRGYRGLHIAPKASRNRCAEPCVVLIDISGLPPEASGGSPRSNPAATSRKKLTRLLRKLTSGSKPRAIAVDIDFSPEGQQYVTQDDPDFLTFCKSLEGEGVKVFLGVERTAGNAEAAWLGHADFSSLAAAITLPADTDAISSGGTPAPYPVEIPFLGGEVPKEARAPRGLRSLGVALASVVEPHIESLLLDEHSWWFEPTTERVLVFGRPISEFAIDPRFASRLERNALTTIWHGDDEPEITGHALSGSWQAAVDRKLVLVGDVNTPPDSTDRFPLVTTFTKTHQSGVVLHGSAAMTLLDSPLRVLTHASRVVMDLVTALLSGALVAVLKSAGFPKRAVLVLPVVAVVIVMLTGLLAVGLASRFGILWLDWIVVAIVVAFHEAVEKRAKTAMHWMTTASDEA